MSQVNSIAGNDGFSRIRDVAAQVSHLNGVDVSAVNLTAGNVNAGILTAQAVSSIPRGVTLLHADLVTNPNNAWWVAATTAPMFDVSTGAVFTFVANTHIVSAELSGSANLAGATATFSAGPSTAGVTTVFDVTPISDITGDSVFVQAPNSTNEFGQTGVTSSISAALADTFDIIVNTANVTAGVVYAKVHYYVKA